MIFFDSNYNIKITICQYFKHRFRNSTNRIKLFKKKKRDSVKLK